ncbi:MAG: methyltransferase domain-containing protein [Thermoplasmata archaeon]|nr:MAG: methyltransferase domain-containing protein [Thermoplasmata archaeon]
MELDVTRLGQPGLEEDDEVAGNQVFARYRRVSLGMLCDAFSPGDRVLDFGCGSGLEAAYLALWGVDVVAVDVLPERVDATRDRARSLGVEDRMDTRLIEPGGLPGLVDQLGEVSLDGAYSSFGPLNCEPDLGAVAGAMGALLREEAPLVASVMNRSCAFEIGRNLARGRPRKAFRRFHPAEGRTGGGDVTVTYYSLKELREAFGEWFLLEGARGLLKMPTPEADPLFRHFPGFLDWAMGFDPRSMAGLGDHLFVVMRRR